MSPSLPRQPSLEHIKKQAKQLLAAHRDGNVKCCSFFRQLNRFSEATDEQILTTTIPLAEAQMVIAIHYGFASWSDLKKDVRTRPDAGDFAIEAVIKRSREKIPEYAVAGVPLSVVAALNKAGVDIDFMEFAAASGWAFSFGYYYNDISPAYMAVRGNPESGGPFEVFAFLPQQFGFEYEMALTAEPDALWNFVKEHVDKGTTIMSEHMDGGLISAYRELNDRRQIYFDGTVTPGWLDADKLQPYAVYSLVKRHEAQPPDKLLRLALNRAVAKGEAHSVKGIPQGMAALHQYLTDISDESKDFAGCEEWFCWAAFERLMARRCSEVWLRSITEYLDDEAAELIAEAADRYGKAYRHYDQYRSMVQAGEPTSMSLQDRARTPERIAAISPILKQGIEAEAGGLTLLRSALMVIT